MRPTDALERRIVQRYGPHRHVWLRVLHESVFTLANLELTPTIPPTGGMSYRRRLTLLIDLPAELVRPRSRWWKRRAPTNTAAPPPVVRIPVEFDLDITITEPRA